MELTTFQRHRLLAQLASFIEDIPTDRLNMNVITGSDATKHSCGSAGCAMGWSATIHNRFGVYLKPAHIIIGMGMYFTTDVQYPIEMHQCRTDIRAFAWLYGIDADQTTDICIPGHYRDEFGTYNPNPRQVAKRIRDVLSRIDPAALVEAYPITTEQRELVTA